MPRKSARKPPPAAVTARCEFADVDPRVVIVDPTFAASLLTRHTRRLEVSLGSNDKGPEQFTRDLPNVGEDALADLDDAGLVRPGTTVRPGAILVGRVTPCSGPATPEAKLLRAIFGEMAGDVRETSLRAPPRCTGEVLEARIDEERAEVVVGWDRPLAVGDVLLVDGEPRTVAEIRPLAADLARADQSSRPRGPAHGETASVVKDALARDALMARGIGPYEPLTQQPIRDADGYAGQVVDAAVLTTLAVAAPWIAWEMSTIKADSVGPRTRVFESLIKHERPDVTPRSAAPDPFRARHVPAGDIFSFFSPDPPAGPDEAAAHQPEVVGVILLHLRALGLAVDLVSRDVGVTLLSPEQIAETSRGQLRSADKLASQRIFGPTTDYACECRKYTRMRDRGILCEVCGVESMTSRVRRERCGHIELITPCVHPLLPSTHAPQLRSLVVLPPDLRGPSIDAAYARVLAADEGALQTAVDALFAAIAEVVDDTLHPRMYSKAVDYSGAAHLVVDPTLAPGDCRVPPEILRELWKPHTYGLLERHGYTTTIKSAKRMLEKETPEALAAVAEASDGLPVLLISGKHIVARRVRAWDAPAIGVDAGTADALGGRVVQLHLPLAHEAALAVAELTDRPQARAPKSNGWLARARRDGRLVDAAVQAAVSGERDPLDDIVVHLALGRPPAPVDESALARWQADDEARREAIHAANHVDEPPAPAESPHLDRSVDELELSVRTANGLANLGIASLRDLCGRSEAELLRSQQIGPKSLRELKEILADMGLSLGMTDV